MFAIVPPPPFTFAGTFQETPLRSLVLIALAAVLMTPQLSYAGALQNKLKTCDADADAKGLTGEGKGDQPRHS